MNERKKKLEKVRELIVKQILNGIETIDDQSIERQLCGDYLEYEGFTIVFNLNNDEEPVCRIEPDDYEGKENEYAIDLFIDSYLFEKDQLLTMELSINSSLANALAKIDKELLNIDIR